MEPGNATLDKAVTVKLTRTLAIIPITVALSLYYAKKEEDLEAKEGKKKLSISSLVPKFIIYFVLASIVTTIALHKYGVGHEVFGPLKTLSKFMIVMAMAAIGLNSNIVKLVKTGASPSCWGLLLDRHYRGQPLAAAYDAFVVRNRRK